MFEVPEENGLVKRFEIGLAVVLDDAPDGEGFRWEDWKSRKEERNADSEDILIVCYCLPKLRAL